MIPLEYIAEKTTVVAKNDEEYMLQEGVTGLNIKLESNSQTNDRLIKTEFEVDQVFNGEEFNEGEGGDNDQELIYNLDDDIADDVEDE